MDLDKRTLSFLVIIVIIIIAAYFILTAPKGTTPPQNGSLVQPQNTDPMQKLFKEPPADVGEPPMP